MQWLPRQQRILAWNSVVQHCDQRGWQCRQQAACSSAHHSLYAAANVSQVSATKSLQKGLRVAWNCCPVPLAGSVC